MRWRSAWSSVKSSMFVTGRSASEGLAQMVYTCGQNVLHFTYYHTGATTRAHASTKSHILKSISQPRILRPLYGTQHRVRLLCFPTSNAWLPPHFISWTALPVCTQRSRFIATMTQAHEGRDSLSSSSEEAIRLIPRKLSSRRTLPESPPVLSTPPAPAVEKDKDRVNNMHGADSVGVYSAEPWCERQVFPSRLYSYIVYGCI